MKKATPAELLLPAATVSDAEAPDRDGRPIKIGSIVMDLEQDDGGVVRYIEEGDVAYLILFGRERMIGRLQTQGSKALIAVTEPDGSLIHVEEKDEEEKGGDEK